MLFLICAVSRRVGPPLGTILGLSSFPNILKKTFPIYEPRSDQTGADRGVCRPRHFRSRQCSAGFYRGVKTATSFSFLISVSKWEGLGVSG